MIKPASISCQLYYIFHILIELLPLLNFLIFSSLFIKYLQLQFPFSEYIDTCSSNSLPEQVSMYLVSNHQFNWWFIISPPKGYCYCLPQRAVSQALLLARYKAVLLESSRLDSSACSFIYF